MDDETYLADEAPRCKDCLAPLNEYGVSRCDECETAFLVGRVPSIASEGKAA